MNVEQRQAIEKRIVSRLIKDAIAAGYAIRIWDGEDWAFEEKSTNCDFILSNMFATDEEWLKIYRDGKCVGGVCLVYGNDGFDVIADNVDNETTNAALKGAEALAEELALKHG